MRLLFLGDVVGRSGRQAVIAQLPKLRARYKLDFVVVNGENSAGGFGITESIFLELLDAGADVVTLGNHAFDQKEALVFIERQPRLIRPTRPHKEKYLTYECGIDPVGVGWSQTQIRYYVFAFLFVIFDVESVFLFPFAAVLNEFSRAGNGGPVFVEMLVFVGVLLVGLLYAWKKKVLEWV